MCIGIIGALNPAAGSRVKYARSVNVAPCTVSGSGVGVPFDIDTQTPPLTLVLEHPVWNPIGVL